MKVLVQSFSYVRTGYPADKTGKGGGFVFDCRTIDVFDASGGYTYDSPPAVLYFVTGQSPVIKEALDKNVEAQEFFDAVWDLVEMDIAKCLRRGFNIMTVNFGCSAGHHRSVYMAEKLVREINKKFPDVECELIHLERAHWPQIA
ncbi:MAG: hypothetical protein A2655_02650 [Candidatus Yanofskybacteria bacterium RIFCSPHIGHO2_01_FULL_43_42]|uniref:RapZ C-terminal domain-containing protein n=1 Tax=Candidatus Yanofskybacteria bacterium RIFCSPLOWO2_01_FULL_43_22 TaxID=1802695 RepID=A0A1F8GJP6_9BACT|nr:MAG: hypothetical protein A2655_02650 [Candidatus Yanofskybacteria bacterium RIFCSPHIGHO2_01_FULL_43_42]OGN12449.1 MAG: hypothetical protein A3D48_00570 [Candidatus Yanofskybacteria bacterium RIFCSPHIGHO2_02_FULL_43_17]OGN24906.1 MAG: hypothetical protein A3A13_03075 [Candidatus Yanofskybacteria bacterium RIFCSPLOWO2_01_FULL_43_22]